MERRRMHILRIAFHCSTKNIPIQLVSNFDHVGMQVLPLGKHTWAPSGGGDVAIMHADDKTQITIVMVESAAGEVLGVQCICQGSTPRCLPPQVNDGRFKTGRIIWHFTYTEDHWANDKTNRELG